MAAKARSAESVSFSTLQFRQQVPRPREWRAQTSDIENIPPIDPALVSFTNRREGLDFARDDQYVGGLIAEAAISVLQAEHGRLGFGRAVDVHTPALAIAHRRGLGGHGHGRFDHLPGYRGLSELPDAVAGPEERSEVTAGILPQVAAAD
jgi:hypothetical protein